MKTNKQENKKLNYKSKSLDSKKLPTFLWYKKKSLQNLNIEKRLINKLNKKEGFGSTGPQKHFVPSIKEWNQSIYTYNKETTKNLPSFDKTASKLIESYLNLYNFEKEEYHKRRRARVNYTRRCFRRITMSKLNFKHTNKNVTIMVHIYNKRIKYYTEIIKTILTLETSRKKDYKFFLHKIKSQIVVLKSFIKMHNDINGIRDIIENYDNYKQLFNNIISLKEFCKNNELIDKILSGIQLKQIYNSDASLLNLFADKKKLEKIFNVYINYKSEKDDEDEQEEEEKSPDEIFNEVIWELMSLEMESLTAKQLNYFEKFKFSKSFLLPLINLLEVIYKKEIKFNFINMKYIQGSASILAENLKNKLKVNTNLSIILKSLLNMTGLWRKRKYYPVVEKRYTLQNITFKDIDKHIKLYNLNDKSKSSFNLKKSNLVNLYGSNNALNEENLGNEGLVSTVYNDPLEKLFNNKNNIISKYNVNKTFAGLKHKYLSAIHLRVAGRLNKRYAAVRSTIQKEHIGNLKNPYSSYGGLPTSLVRGFVNSNVQYSSSKGLRRAGSYGVKIWINTN